MPEKPVDLKVCLAIKLHLIMIIKWLSIILSFLLLVNVFTVDNVSLEFLRIFANTIPHEFKILAKKESL